MKIKRFEASNMSEALRQIKKEFGEEAVILSAKTMKKGQGLLGKKSAQKVVVTAAMDKRTKASMAENIPAAESGLGASSHGDNQSDEKNRSVGSSILNRFSPITKTGRKILKPKMVQHLAAPEQAQPSQGYYQRLKETGLNDAVAAEWDEQMLGLLPDNDAPSREVRQALSQAIQAKGIVGSLHNATPGQRKCVVLMGPAGVGKTSAAAKMAAKQALHHPNSIAIISMDNLRVAGSTELERFAKIMGVPFNTAYTAEELEEALSRFDSYALVIIDTPGIGSNDPVQREKLRRTLDSVEHAEHLLLLNAAVQENAMGHIIDYFKPLNIHSLFFTGLDWAVDYGMMINQSVNKGLPIGYLSDSPKIPEGIRTATADHMAQLLFGQDEDEAQGGFKPISFIEKRKTANAPYYVANRNSDIFHFHECKAVKRINTDNMVVFNDPADAMGQQFKPCRMCCSELIVPKPFNRLVSGYAGNRC